MRRGKWKFRLLSLKKNNFLFSNSLIYYHWNYDIYEYASFLMLKKCVIVNNELIFTWKKRYENNFIILSRVKLNCKIPLNRIYIVESS